MTGRRGGRRPLHWIAFGLAAAGNAATAGAQPVQPLSTATAPSPVSSEPSPSPFTRPLADQSAAVPLADSANLPIRTVQVAPDTSGSTAVPPDGWMPPTDASGTLTLAHSPREPLDAAWVQKQFDRQLTSGPLRPSMAIALLELINRAFVTAGFVNSGVVLAGPVSGGLLNLRLVYGRVASANPAAPGMTIQWGNQGARGLSEAYIRSRFPSAKDRPLSALDLERDFRLLDESEAIRSISAALRPGALPGEADLHVIVYPASRFDVYAGFANDRSPAVGSNHVFAGGYGRSLIASGDLLTLEGGVTSGVHDGQAGYSTPLLTPRLSMNLRASFNNAAVVTSALAPLNIRAKDRSFEGGFEYEILHSPLMMRGANDRWSPSQSLAGGLSFVVRRQKTYLLGEPFSFAPGSVNGRSEYEAVRVSSNYIRRDLNRVVALALAATIGLDGTRSDVPAIPNPRRDFAALLGQLNVAQRIGHGFELRGRVTGQYSHGTLYSGLRLSAGGSQSVRGYRESLFLVDQAVIGSVELAHSFRLFRGDRNAAFGWDAFTASIFADAAAFRNSGPSQPSEHRLASVGASVEWIPSPAIHAAVTFGQGLTHVALPNERSLQDRGIQFRVIVHPGQFF